MSELTWIDPDGVAFPLQVPGEVRTLTGVIGRTFTPVVYDDETVPFQAGERLRQIRHGAREISVPLLIQGQDQREVRDRLRAWSRRFDTTRGEGRLVSAMFGSDQRELPCRFVGLLETGEQNESDRAQRVVAVFRAFDPFFRDTADTVSEFDSGALMFFPFFPLTLSGGAVFATPTINNDGDASAYPIWRINGPGGPVALTNLTTGATLELTTTLTAGQSIVIDTRPFVRSIVDQDGTNLYADRTPGSSLWELAPGPNQVQILLSLSSAASSVELRYRRRWLGA